MKTKTIDEIVRVHEALTDGEIMPIPVARDIKHLAEEAGEYLAWTPFADGTCEVYFYYRGHRIYQEMTRGELKEAGL